MTRENLYTKEYQVHVYETGPDGKAGLINIFNYFQDIASEHAELLGFGRKDLLERNCFWVLSRIYAEFTDFPCWNDKLAVNTWPNGTDSVFAMRNYEIINNEGKIIGKANSAWLIVDIDSKKIQRPESHFPVFMFPHRKEDDYARIPNKLKPPPDGFQTGEPVSNIVRNSDLDINLHMNNVNYLKWVYDTYPLDFIMKSTPVSVEINYLAETAEGNEIIINSFGNSTKNTKDHYLVRKNDSKEVCRMQLNWNNAG